MLNALRGLGKGFSFREMLDTLMATGASNERIEHFLDADVGGRGSIRDHITARMTNDLARMVGQPADTDAAKVKAIREAEKKRPPLKLKPGEPDPFRK